MSNGKTLGRWFGFIGWVVLVVALATPQVFSQGVEPASESSAPATSEDTATSDTPVASVASSESPAVSVETALTLPGDLPPDGSAPNGLVLPPGEGDEATPEVVELSKAETAPTKSNLQGLILFGGMALIILASYFLSNFFAKRWRMPEYQPRYFLILFCFIAAATSTILGLTQKRMNLGIDLRGGSILVYEVSPNVSDAATPEEIEAAKHHAITAQQMNELKAAIAKRINPAGVKEIAIQELGNNSEVKITIPEADEAEVARIERIVNSAGQLKFRILASRSASEEKELIDLATSPTYAKAHEIRLDQPIGKDRIIIGGTWTPIDPTQSDSFRVNGDFVVREAPEISLAAQQEGLSTSYEALVLELTDLYNVFGKHLAHIQEGVGDMGQPVVHFSMTNEGAERMRHLTDRYRKGAERAVGRPMGIVLNDSLYNAPAIEGTIDRSGQITMGRSDMSAESRTRIQKDVRDLIQVMNAGVLPAKLSDHPVTKMMTGPTLGEDTIRKGKNSILWGGILILAFMVAYYGFGGVIACFAILMNLVLIMAVMLSLRAAFTLPGLAGLVLTVGMAVDANVLIFERIKEELGGGASLKMAIHNGFSRAFSAIFDSNITTMITAVILYIVGTDQIKGFAVTLFLGVAFSLFTATYVSRIIFETAEKINAIGKNCVLPIIPGLRVFGRTSYDFMAKQRVCFTISLVLITVGLLAVLGRGKGIFDIDFVGGVEVQAMFEEPQSISDIRSKLGSLSDLSVSNLSLSKDRFGNPVPDNSCFTISTSCPPGKDAETYRNEVEKLLHASFGDALRHNALTYGEVRIESVKFSGANGTEEAECGIVELMVSPAVAHEVIDGYFADERDAFVAERSLNGLEFTLTNPGYSLVTQENPFAVWTLTVRNGDLPLVKNFIETVANAVSEKSSFESSQTIGSSVASYARTQGILAILASLVCIIIYIWFRFKRAIYGISAVIALVHDVLITLGFLAASYWLAPFFGFAGISEFKIGLPTVAAFLTIIGYSLNDTIILFDRIRELCGKNTDLSTPIVNKAINQTLSRTILTSMTTLFVAVVLYFFGGSGIHTFAFALCVGILTGTYSSIFVAPPIMLWMLKQKRS